MFGYGGSCVLTGAVTMTLIGSPDGAAPPPAFVVSVPPPAAVVSDPPPAVVSDPPPAVVVAPPPAVVAAAAVVADDPLSSSSPHAAATNASTLMAPIAALHLVRRRPVFPVLDMTFPRFGSCRIARLGRDDPPNRPPSPIGWFSPPGGPTQSWTHVSTSATTSLS